MANGKSHIVLVTGGARSGKSRFAEQYVRAKGEKIAYIATAQVGDQEMKSRIEKHIQRRPSDWATYEAPFAAERYICQAMEKHDMILFDCVTLYLSNLLCQNDRYLLGEEFQHKAEEAMQKILKVLVDEDVSIVFVTNEVGAGIVPENRLARIYRDVAGLINQKLAEKADEVYFVVSGIPLKIKGEATWQNQ